MDDKWDKEEEEFRYKDGKRHGLYGFPGCGPNGKDLNVVIIVDEDDCTKEEQQFYADWIAIGLAGKLGHEQYHDEILKSMENIKFRLEHGGRMTQKIYSKIMGMLYYAGCWMFGNKHLRPMEDFNDFPGDLPDNGQVVRLTHQGYYHIGSKKDN